MLFSLKVKGYKALMNVFKILDKIIPIPKPTLFTGAGSPIDAAKVISVIMTNHKPINKLAGWFKVPVTLGCLFLPFLPRQALVPR